MPFWDNALAGVGQGIAGGVNNYLEGDFKQKAEARAQQQEADRQKQLAMTLTKEQRALDTQTYGAVQDAQVSDLRAAVAGDEAAARRAAQRFPTIAQYRNQAYGLHDPIPAAPVGAPIYGTGHPAVAAQPARTLDQQGPTDTGAPLGPITTMPTVAQPAQAPQTSFTTQKTLDYLRGGLYLPPSAPQKLTPGETIATIDPITNKPSNTYAAPDPKGESLITYREQQLRLSEERVRAAIANGKDSLELRQQAAKNAEERLAIAREKAGAAGKPTETDYMKLNMSRDQHKADTVQRARLAFQAAHTRTIKDKFGAEHIETPTAAELDAEEARAAAAYDRAHPPLTRPLPTVAQPTPGSQRGKVVSGLPIPPVDYGDTRVFARVENVASQATKLGLGTVSSRARSDARDAQAKKEAGVPAGRNNHGERNVLDFVPSAGQRSAAEEFFKQRGGSPEWHGNHLHVTFPEVQSAVPQMSDQLAAFYQKHGIEMGAANA